MRMISMGKAAGRIVYILVSTPPICLCMCRFSEKNGDERTSMKGNQAVFIRSIRVRYLKKRET
ncbi:hypothetical protein DV714_10985 [Parageobacillus thermoglucosidasius]|nr:hypothetical protein DV714_10985 [Parageobacillus thermoglucosidasius]